MYILTLPLELRNKIFTHALEVPDEFLICECPEHLRNHLGLCDFTKEFTAWMSLAELWHCIECRVTRMLKNPKTPLLLLCKQTADELKETAIRLPILVFCSAKCCFAFMRELGSSHGSKIKWTDIWALKIKRCADPQSDTDGCLTTTVPGLMDSNYMPSFMEIHSLKMVSREDNGYHPPAMRVVEIRLENDEKCKLLEGTSARMQLHKEDAVTKSKEAPGVKEGKINGVEDQTANKNKEDVVIKSKEVTGIKGETPMESRGNRLTRTSRWRSIQRPPQVTTVSIPQRMSNED